MSKHYVPFEELVPMLSNDKNIVGDTINKDIFKEHSYVSVINPFKDYVCLNHVDGEHRIYPENVSFDDFKQLKLVDNFISNRLFIYIRTFEESLKANLCIILSQKMAALGDITCTDFSLFEELLVEGENRLNMVDIYHRYENTRLIEANDITVRKNYDVIFKIIQMGNKLVLLNNDLYTHYQENYEKIPIWIILEQLTFGELQTIFNLLKLRDRISFVTQISGERKNNRYVISFSNKINYIRIIRNRVCHGASMIALINSLQTEEEKHRFINIIRLLKINYYNYFFHEKSKVVKPSLKIERNEYNDDRISFLEWVLKMI